MSDYLILRRPGLRALAVGNAYRGIQRDRPGGLDELCPDHPVTRANEWYTSVAPAGSPGVVTSLEQARALVDAYARWGYGDFEVVEVRTVEATSPALEPAGQLLGFDVGAPDRSLLRAAGAPAAALNDAGLFADPASAQAWLDDRSDGLVIEVVLVHPLPAPASAEPAPAIAGLRLV